MQITDEMRWKFIAKYWDNFHGDVFKYEDGSFMFSPYREEGTQGGKDLESFVDRMIRKESKK
jgi:hypothetical protein